MDVRPPLTGNARHIFWALRQNGRVESGAIVFDAADFGVPTLGLTYITREELIDADPDTVARFVKATMKGLEFAFEHTEETLDIVMKFAENEDLPNTTNPDDWARISGKKGERIVYIRTLVTGKNASASRAIDTEANTGQYL